MSMAKSSSPTRAMLNIFQVLGQPPPILMGIKPSMLQKSLVAEPMIVSCLTCGALVSLHSCCTPSSLHSMPAAELRIGATSVDPTMSSCGRRSSVPATTLSFRKNWKPSSTPCGVQIHRKGPGSANWKKPSMGTMKWFENSQDCNGLPGLSIKLKASLMSFHAVVPTKRFMLLAVPQKVGIGLYTGRRLSATKPLRCSCWTRVRWMQPMTMAPWSWPYMFFFFFFLPVVPLAFFSRRQQRPSLGRTALHLASGIPAGKLGCKLRQRNHSRLDGDGSRYRPFFEHQTHRTFLCLEVRVRRELRLMAVASELWTHTVAISENRVKDSERGTQFCKDLAMVG